MDSRRGTVFGTADGRVAIRFVAAAGWEAGLEVVEAQLDGTPISWDPLDRAEELAAAYQ